MDLLKRLLLNDNFKIFFSAMGHFLWPSSSSLILSVFKIKVPTFFAMHPSLFYFCFFM